MSIVIRKKSNNFFSIEKVFQIVSQRLNSDLIELPKESLGVFNRLLNIYFIFKLNLRLIHISGHDHYLLWYPFKNAILTIHDIEALKRKSGIRKCLFQKLWFDIPIKNATVVTTISEFTKQELLELNQYDTPIQVIPNPITMDIAYTPKVIWQEKVKVLHIGTKENKNLLRLVDALSKIDCELTIIGKLSLKQIESLASNEIDYRNKLNLSDVELKEEYLRADLVAFVSTYEGFGLPILEAQAIGRVVITSNISSMPEVAGDGAYFIDPYSVESIRDGICRLKEDEKLREELIEKGIENSKRFEPELIAKQYMNLYRSLEA